MLGSPTSDARPDMKRTAGKHGDELLRNEFTIDQVVHDYGDLCQSITELAIEQGQSISVPEFSELNMTLDTAIATAVGEWSRRSNIRLADAHAGEINERLELPRLEGRSAGKERRGDEPRRTNA